MSSSLMHIVGNRPQFIKLAPISRELKKRDVDEIIVHTGQHFDENMSDIFFEELSIPKPHINLNINGGSHTQMTAKMMLEIEKVIEEYNPKIVVLYGDTNSTLAASLVCSKLNVPIAHIEAGPRSFNKANPEECNRIITDHMSKYLFCPDKISLDNLINEGITKHVYLTGDVMYDMFLHYVNNDKDCDILRKNNLSSDDYILMTWHRQENTSDMERIESIINFISKINYKIIFPIHPRTKKILIDLNLWEKLISLSNLIIIDPIGYIDTVKLISNCKLVITDSGGLSKESYFGGARCLLLLNDIAWPELTKLGHIININPQEELDIVFALNFIKKEKRKVNNENYNFFGDGTASRKIVDILEKELYR